MESLRENKKLQYGLGLAYAVVWISVAEVFPPINDALEVSLPSSGVAVAVVIASVIAAAVALPLCQRPNVSKVPPRIRIESNVNCRVLTEAMKYLTRVVTPRSRGWLRCHHVCVFLPVLCLAHCFAVGAAAFPALLPAGRRRVRGIRCTLGADEAYELRLATHARDGMPTVGTFTWDSCFPVFRSATRSNVRETSVEVSIDRPESIASVTLMCAAKAKAKAWEYNK